MLHGLVLASALVAATPSQQGNAAIEPVEVACRAPDQYRYCTDNTMYVELRRSEPVVVAHVRVGIGRPLTIHFPPGVELPEGAIVEGNRDVFRVTRAADPIRLSVQVVIPHSAKEKAKKQEANPAVLVLDTPGSLQLRTRRGFLIDLKMRVGKPESSVAMMLVRSDELQREYEICSGRLAEERSEELAKIQNERQKMADERKAVGRSQMAYALMDEGRCREWQKVAFVDQMRVEVSRVCQTGPDLYVVFVVKNRGRNSKFRLDTALVVGEESAPVQQEDAVLHFLRRQGDNWVPFELDDVELDFNELVTGTVTLPADSAPKSFSLKLTERGGLQRVVVVERISL